MCQWKMIWVNLPNKLNVELFFYLFSLFSSLASSLFKKFQITSLSAIVLCNEINYLHRLCLYFKYKSNIQTKNIRSLLHNLIFKSGTWVKLNSILIPLQPKFGWQVATKHLMTFNSCTCYSFALVTVSRSFLSLCPFFCLSLFLSLATDPRCSRKAAHTSPRLEGSGCNWFDLWQRAPFNLTNVNVALQTEWPGRVKTQPEQVPAECWEVMRHVKSIKWIKFSCEDESGNKGPFWRQIC